MFDSAVDSKPAACDWIRLRVRDMSHGARVAAVRLIEETKRSMTAALIGVAGRSFLAHSLDWGSYRLMWWKLRGWLAWQSVLVARRGWRLRMILLRLGDGRAPSHRARPSPSLIRQSA